MSKIYLLAAFSFYLMFLVTASAQEGTSPTIDSSVVFAEIDGLVAIEAEHFSRQELTDKRAWYLTTADVTPDVSPDGDASHIAGASRGAYVELLPDTRRNHGDKLIAGENFSNEPGRMAVLTYPVHFATPGKYWLWARAFTTTTEDNGLHFGVDGTWPETAQRWQTVTKGKWHWESRQRTTDVHVGVPGLLTLDVPAAGLHTIHIAMREDGIALDRILLVNRQDYQPNGIGPETKLHAGSLPAAPRIVTAAALPAEQPNADNKADSRVIAASEFDREGSGYYLDRGKWLAINPERNKQAKASIAFPFPSGRYHLTLQAVGESDGKSTYQVLLNGTEIGNHSSPVAAETYEEGSKFQKTFKDLAIDSGDIIEVASQIGSLDGKEFSRARWAGIVIEPADEATLAAMPTKASPRLVTVADIGPALVGQRQPDGDGSIKISGERQPWHKITLTLDGPFAHEQDRDPNPFTDQNMNVTLIHESGAPKYIVLGHFAADGNAAESSAESGTKWRVNFSPDKPGTWTYKVAFTRGKHAALGEAGVAVAPYDGLQGDFVIGSTSSSDLISRGRLQYIGKHHLQFAGSGQPFIKAGTDSPETLLAYNDFDGTEPGRKREPKTGKVAANHALHRYQAHEQDWRTSDPTWQGGKGKGLIGAVNYLAEKGVNSISFLPYNAGGDGDNVWPFVARTAKLHYDCSKLDQWTIVLDHANSRGLHLHFKLQENEMDDDRRGQNAEDVNVEESLDGGKLGWERKLYCREMVSRFGHELALNWNIGEENTQSTAEVREMVAYLNQVDPYDHNIVIHTFPGQQDKVYTPLLGDASKLTGTSLQNPWNAVHQRTLNWVKASQAAGRPWVVANDEQNSASTGAPNDPGYAGHNGVATADGKSYALDDIRKLTLWGNLMAGGGGVEYYFGYQLPQNDLVCEDFRSRDRSWDYCRIAIGFFGDEKIPVQEMVNRNSLIGNERDDNSRYCFAKDGELYLVYLPGGGTCELDLAGLGAGKEFQVTWFNPRQGGAPVQGSVKAIRGDAKSSIGTPPESDGEDWLAIVR